MNSRAVNTTSTLRWVSAGTSSCMRGPRTPTRRLATPLGRQARLPRSSQGRWRGSPPTQRRAQRWRTAANAGHARATAHVEP
eukprot:2177556-Alexandrium_andersonii.AAC.1